MPTYNNIQIAIQELCELQKPYESIINNSERLKELELLIISATSYADSISILIKECKYDSVLPVGRAFLELYPSIIYMLESFSNLSEFDNYFKKLVVDDMTQDVLIYKSIKEDITIPESITKDADLASYIVRWENMINCYFPNRNSEIDKIEKEDSLIQIIQSLEKSFKKQYGKVCGKKNTFIGDAIIKNKQIISVLGRPYESSYTIYRLLCSECHGNIGALDTRVITNGAFVPNIGSKNNATAVAGLIYWSLKDIATRFEQVLKQNKS